MKTEVKYRSKPKTSILSRKYARRSGNIDGDSPADRSPRLCCASASKHHFSCYIRTLFRMLAAQLPSEIVVGHWQFPCISIKTPVRTRSLIRISQQDQTFSWRSLVNTIATQVGRAVLRRSPRVKRAGRCACRVTFFRHRIAGSLHHWGTVLGVLAGSTSVL